MPPRVRLEVPAAPSLRGTLRAAIGDLSDNAAILAVANLGWAAVLFVAASLLARHPLGVLGLALLILPSAGLMRMATFVVRSGRCRLGDFLDGMRRDTARTLGIGLAQLLLVVLAGADVLIGLGLGGLPGVVLVVGGGYILVAIWIYACVAWPLLIDPLRADVALGARLRLAAILVLARPIPAIGIGVTILVLLVAGTLLLIPIIAFAASLAALLAAHWTLPTADHLEGRATIEREVEP